jgi:hypothetical protein
MASWRQWSIGLFCTFQWCQWFADYCIGQLQRGTSSGPSLPTGSEWWERNRRRISADLVQFVSYAFRANSGQHQNNA